MDCGPYSSMSNVMVVLNDNQYFRMGGHLQEYFLCVFFVNTLTKTMIA